MSFIVSISYALYRILPLKQISKLLFIEILLACLESAYSLIWSAHRIWGQDLGTFMISGPV